MPLDSQILLSQVTGTRPSCNWYNFRHIALINESIFVHYEIRHFAFTNLVLGGTRWQPSQLDYSPVMVQAAEQFDRNGIYANC